MYEPQREQRRRGHSLFPQQSSTQSLRNQYSRGVNLAQLIEEFRNQDEVYEPVPPTPPPRAPGRRRSSAVRFASPLGDRPRRRPKTPMTAPVIYDVSRQQTPVASLPFAVPEEEEVVVVQEMRRSPPKEGSPLSARQESEESQSVNLDGFPMPPTFGEREYLTPVPETEDWLDLEETTGKVYDFDPSRPSGEAGREDDASELETPLSDNSTLREEEPPLSRAFYVYQSRYTGEAVLGGSHSAELDIVHDERRRRQSLFRWLHVQQDMMNFDDFTNEISRSLSESEQNDLRKLLSDVRKNYSKTIRTSRNTTVKHMEPGYLQQPLQTDPSRGTQHSTRSATWLCIPYFSLEEYSGILSAVNSGSYPAQTLLQLFFSRNSQKRDMTQATRQIGNGGKNSCFHVRQLWCVVLENSVLITCGSMSEASLRGDAVKIVSEPARDSTLGADFGRILIQYGDSVLWSFPLQECQTWFAFIAHFSDFWPKAMRFQFNGRVLTEAKWWKVLQFARTSRRNVTITMETCAPPQLPPSGILRPIGPAMSHAGPQSPVGLQPPPLSTGKHLSYPPGHGKSTGRFHVFSWAENHSSSPVDGPNFIVLQKQLSGVEEFLTAETNGSDRRAYLDADMSTREAVYEYLAQHGASLQESKNKPWKKRDYEERVDVFNAADTIFRFFLPPLFDGPTTDKYWGAIMSLVWLPLPDAPEDETHPHELGKGRRDAVYANAPILRKALRQLALPILAFKNILSHAEPANRLAIDDPLDLIRAWLHLVMGLIYASHETQKWEDHLDVADELVKSGMKHIMERLSNLKLMDRSSVLPLEMVSLMSYGLMSNASGKYAGISDTYSEYLKALENEIANGQSDLSYQQRINFLRQEVAVINRTIAAQNDVFNSILSARDGMAATTTRHLRMNRVHFNEAQGRNYQEVATLRSRLRKAGNRYEDDDEANALLEPLAEVSDFYKLPSTDAAGFRDLLAAECAQLLERRARDFDEYAEQADVLEQTNLNNAAVTKDKQEQAIYAFTIVTIVFLPLSAVSSIFGMNTSDVRDMAAGQWLYWATAIPVTVLTIVIGLWWMGELSHLFNWVASKGRGNASFGARFPAHADVSEKPNRYEGMMQVIRAPTAVYTRRPPGKESFARRINHRLGDRHSR